MKPLDPPLRRRIVIDTREQLPWEFAVVDEHGEYHQYPQLVATLGEGDYSLEGLEQHVRIERKSLEDFIITITHWRERWEREMLRLQETITHPAVFVEGSWKEIAEAAYRSQVNPRAVLASVDAFEHDFPRVHFRFCGSRIMAERMAIIRFSVIEKRIDKPKGRKRVRGNGQVKG